MRYAGVALQGLSTLAASSIAAAAASPIMVVGLDITFTIDDAGTKLFGAATGDAVLVYGFDNPAYPALPGSLPPENTIVGPPTNLGVAPDGRRPLACKYAVGRIGIVAVADGHVKPDMPIGL